MIITIKEAKAYYLIHYTYTIYWSHNWSNKNTIVVIPKNKNMKFTVNTENMDWYWIGRRLPTIKVSDKREDNH